MPGDGNQRARQVQMQDKCICWVLKVVTLSVQLQLSSFTVSDCVEGVADVIGGGRFEYVFGMVQYIPTRLWLYPNISFGLVWKPAQAFTQLLLKVSTTVMLVHCWLHTLVRPMSRPDELTRRTLQKTTRIYPWYVPPKFNANTGLMWVHCWLHMLVRPIVGVTPDGQLNRKQSWVNKNALS